MKVIGEYDALWILLPISPETLNNLLPSHFGEYSQAFPQSNNEQYVWVELGKEHDCGPSWGSMFRSTFHEAKCNVPFLQPKFGDQQDKLVNYKARVYMDHYVNSTAGYYMYGLNSTYCHPFTYTDELYEFKFRNKFNSESSITAEFKAEGEFKPWKEQEGMEIYNQMINQTWFSGEKSYPIFGNHVYDLDKSSVRPVTGKLSWKSSDISNPAQDITFEFGGVSGSSPLAAVQIRAFFTIQ